MNRHEQRIKAFQILFQIDNDIVDLKNVKFFDLYVAMPYIKETIDYYIEHQNEINKIISEKLNNYTLDRISKVDRNVLRLAASELLSTNTPKKIIVNEAVKITKIYSDVNSYKFVNGVLKNFINE
ncbi:MAG TPA: transcription antitermination factor NusB [Candidatus Nosocomiicoccus stercorigallinarum]|nr:transcription antitermination factor NusB [Candidatus Nosocomiicoccus stercorigallinarum]